MFLIFVLLLSKSVLGRSIENEVGIINEPGSVLQAIALTFICVLFTAIGSIIPLIDILLKKIGSLNNLSNSPLFWASALAFSSGIMLFMSMASLFPEGLEMLEKSGSFDSGCYFVASCMFALGVLFILVINWIIHWIHPEYQCKCHSIAAHESHPHKNHEPADIKGDKETDAPNESNRDNTTFRRYDVDSLSCDSPAIHKDLDFITIHTEEEIECQSQSNKTTLQSTVTFNKKSLEIMGWQTAIALALHHIPEGIAIFAATRIDLYSGFLVAIGLGLHYTPEAMTVVLPLYLASKSAWKPILSTVLITGLACPIGGLFAWLFYLSNIDNLTAGLILCWTSGFLAYITVDGLLISANAIDVKNKVVSKFMFLGILLMALTNALLEYFHKK